MEPTFDVIETEDLPTLAIRTTTSVEALPQRLGLIYSQILAHMNDAGGQPVDAPFILYHNMDMQNLDVEIGFPVNSPLSGQGEIAAGVIAGGRKAVGIHRGPYQKLAGTYDAMAAWMNENGHQPTGAVYEFYLNSPMEVPESELLTRVMFPLL